MNANSMQLHVHDGSVDYKGRYLLRALTGSWKASLFILVIEFSERLSYFGIGTNLITYLTMVMHQDLETAVNTVNLWGGVNTIMPFLGGFIADAYTGRFSVILFSAVLYLLGLSLFTMSQFIPSLKPCSSTSTPRGSSTCQHVSNVHKEVFFVALYLVGIAMGGFRPCLQAFGADQFEDNYTKERKQKMSFFNWWNISLCLGMFLGLTVIVYTQDNVGWGVAFLTLAITMGVMVVIFVIGRSCYRYRTAQGSPLTPMLQVAVAAFVKRNLPYPSNPSLLYEIPNSEEHQGRLLDYTNRLRFLDYAAIIEELDSETSAVKTHNPWRLATVTQVEELKLIIKTIPRWLTSLVYGIGLSQSNTFVIKQGSEMNRRIIHNFEIPPASLAIMSAIGIVVTLAVYDKVLIPYLRRTTGNERGISILNRIGIGMVLLVISMMVSALVERKRLRALQNHGRKLSVFWLVPQTLIIGIGDGFSLVGMQEYFYEQFPDSMRSLGMAFYLSILGVGSFVTTLLVIIVNSLTGMNGGKKWIGKDVNHSRLDYFYWLLTAIFGLNTCAFMLVAKNHSYKNVKPSVPDIHKNDEVEFAHVRA